MAGILHASIPLTNRGSHEAYNHPTEVYPTSQLESLTSLCPYSPKNGEHYRLNNSEVTSEAVNIYPPNVGSSYTSTYSSFTSPAGYNPGPPSLYAPNSIHSDNPNYPYSYGFTSVPPLFDAAGQFAPSYVNMTQSEMNNAVGKSRSQRGLNSEEGKGSKRKVRMKYSSFLANIFSPNFEIISPYTSGYLAGCSPRIFIKELEPQRLGARKL